MIPETITQLLEWLRLNCYADSYAIGEIKIYEGYGLDFNGSAYVWYYTERGQRQELLFFPQEKEAVTHAFNVIRADRYADRHMIGFVSSRRILNKLTEELKNRNIKYFDDMLLYSDKPPQNRYRVFVFGCDVQKVGDLKQRYGYEKKPWWYLW